MTEQIIEKAPGTFKIGEHVGWNSHARGIFKEKVGDVFAIVPAGEHPGRYVPNGYRLDFGTREPRAHESYLVRTARRSRLYWPRVHQLQKAGR